MSNLKSLIAALAEMRREQQEVICEWHDALEQRGYDVPSGDELRKGIKEKQNGKLQKPEQ